MSTPSRHSDGLPARARRGGRYLAEHGDRVAWIMGSSRSGSTWLLQMLADVDRVVAVDDPHLGHHLGVWRPLPLAWAAAEEPPDLTTLLEVKRHKPDYFFSDAHRDAWLPALRELVRTRFGAQLADESKPGSEPVLVVKEPGSHTANLLLDAIPGSRLVFLLRDGRDVVDSWLDAYQQGSWAIEEGAFPVAPRGRLALVEWLSSVWAYRTRAVAAAYRELPAEQRILVRYEELLADPVPELGRVCAAIGLEVTDQELERIAGAHAYSRVAPNRRGKLQQVRSATPGGWQRNLERRERAAMHRIMGPILSELGYAPAGGRAAA